MTLVRPEAALRMRHVPTGYVWESRWGTGSTPGMPRALPHSDACAERCRGGRVASPSASPWNPVQDMF